MNLTARLLPPLAFVAAAGLAVLTGYWLAGAAERLTRDELTRVLREARLDWVGFSVDGMTAHLEGVAPDEGARLTALRVASGVVPTGRLSDSIEVPRAQANVAPVFRIEAMRSHDAVSLIGLVPEAMDGEALLAQLAGLGAGTEVADMLQTADHATPPGWDFAVEFAVEALRRLAVGQVSVAAGRIEVHALVDSPAERDRLTAELRALAPEDQALVLDLVAPRPVIAPFVLRFSLSDTGPRMEACSAETATGREAIERAARAAGLSGRIPCAIGLGSPSPRWPQAAEQAIAALAGLGAGTVTLSDQSVLLQARHDIDREVLDRAAARLEAALPPAFALRTEVLPEPEAETGGPSPELTPTLQARLTDAGALTITGRLPDALIRDAVGTYARARFGSQAVTIETRIDTSLPAGWSMRVLAGLEALTELHHGRLTVTEDRISLTGVTGNPDATAEVSGALTARLGAADGIGLDITYDEALDPVQQEPTPERCEVWIRQIASDRKITFAPGSARLDSTSNEVLDALAEVLRTCGELPLEVAGHTDSQGRDETNLTLSQSRAEAVVLALSMRGVLVASMEARGYGAAEPVADNATEDGREANRRIAFGLIRAVPDLDALDDEARAGLEAGLVIEPQTPGAGQTRPEARPARQP